MFSPSDVPFGSRRNRTCPKGELACRDVFPGRRYWRVSCWASCCSGPKPPHRRSRLVPLDSNQTKEIAKGYRAEALKLKTVTNDKGEMIGRIDDFIFGRESPDIFAVLAVGEFIGLGDHLVAVPFRSSQARRSLRFHRAAGRQQGGSAEAASFSLQSLVGAAEPSLRRWCGDLRRDSRGFLLLDSRNSARSSGRLRSSYRLSGSVVRRRDASRFLTAVKAAMPDQC